MTPTSLESATRDPVVAFLVALGMMSLLMLIPELWLVVWSVIVSFLLFEFLMSRLVRGGSGIVQFSPLGTQSQHKGHAFLGFVVLILIVTLLTAGLAELIAKGIETSWPLELAANFVACLLLYRYMDMQYYRRN
jgi:hypothetical protein